MRTSTLAACTYFLVGGALILLALAAIHNMGASSDACGLVGIALYAGYIYIGTHVWD